MGRPTSRRAPASEDIFARPCGILCIASVARRWHLHFPGGPMLLSGSAVGESRPLVRVRVLIADDHPLVRRWLRAILEAHTEWEVCGEASSGPDAFGKAKELRPEVVIMDISMPGPSGLEATRQIREVVPQAEVLMVAMP